MSVKFKPLGTNILVKPADPLAITEGGIVIPDNAKEKQQRGTVVAVGPGRVVDDGSLVVPDVNLGDEILFKRYAGDNIEIDYFEYIVLPEDQVLGILS